MLDTKDLKRNETWSHIEALTIWAWNVKGTLTEFMEQELRHPDLSMDMGTESGTLDKALAE